MAMICLTVYNDVFEKNSFIYSSISGKVIKLLNSVIIRGKTSEKIDQIILNIWKQFVKN